MTWTDPSPISSASWTAARESVHYGAYLLASVAHSVLAAAEDDSHSNLAFQSATESLGTRELGHGLTLHLDIQSLRLELQRKGSVVDTTRLSSRTIDESLAWVAQSLKDAGISASIARRTYPDFPDHPLMTDGRFESRDEPARRALAAWFSNATDLLGGIRAAEGEMSEPRVWPHHFDLGALISESEDLSRSIGLGFSPGDEHFGEPYFYCSPYPAPNNDGSLPALAQGRWITHPFTSAILTETDLNALESGSRGPAAQRYFAEAIEQCRALIRDGADERP